jgi:hypothetical protein
LVCVVLLAAFGTAAADRPAPPLWGALKPGSYAVGYRVVYAFDHSRSWQSAQDKAGRPVRISVWYPAAGNGRPMRITDYIRNKAPKPFAAAEADLEQRDTRVTMEWAPPSAGNNLMQAELTASRDVQAAKGRFPLLLYSSGINPYTESNLVMAEYLASHGFVVATVASLGESGLHPEQVTDNANLETDARDLEFAWSLLRAEPDVAPDSFGTFGHSLGGVVAVMLAVRNSDIAAVAGLDGSYGFPDTRVPLCAAEYECRPAGYSPGVQRRGFEHPGFLRPFRSLLHFAAGHVSR